MLNARCIKGKYDDRYDRIIIIEWYDEGSHPGMNPNVIFFYCVLICVGLCTIDISNGALDFRVQIYREKGNWEKG